MTMTITVECCTLWLYSNYFRAAIILYNKSVHKIRPYSSTQVKLAYIKKANVYCQSE